MVPCTRRRALLGAAGVLAALAGCSGSSSGSDRSGGPEPGENVETEPDHHALRNSRNGPAVWIGSGDGGSGSTPDDDARRRRSHGLIATRRDADRLAFADVDGADGARAFVEGTDFDRETLLIEPDSVGECYDLQLCYVTWSATEYHTYYARHYRDVDVACSTDDRDRVAHFIRIPDTIDPERVRGSGSGTTSGTCHGWERRLERRRAEANATADPDGDDTEAASGGRG